MATLVVFKFFCVVLALFFRTWLTLPDLGCVRVRVRVCVRVRVRGRWGLTTLKTGRFKQPPKLGSVCQLRPVGRSGRSAASSERNPPLLRS